MYITIMTCDDDIIPNKDLQEGSRIALDNARKLSDAMDCLYNAKLYESGIVLGTLALEEIGKSHYLLKNYVDKNTVKKNDKIFRDHDFKLNALIDYYKNNDNNSTVEELKHDLVLFRTIRFQLLYADWDTPEKQWIKLTVNKFMISYVKHIVQVLIKDFIKYLGGDADLTTAHYSDILKLLDEQQIFLKCQQCKFIIKKPEEIIPGCKCGKKWWKAYWIKH